VRSSENPAENPVALGPCYLAGAVGLSRNVSDVLLMNGLQFFLLLVDIDGTGVCGDTTFMVEKLGVQVVEFLWSAESAHESAAVERSGGEVGNLVPTE
jgi:hypothetical protein